MSKIKLKKSTKTVPASVLSFCISCNVSPCICSCSCTQQSDAASIAARSATSLVNVGQRLANLAVETRYSGFHD